MKMKSAWIITWEWNGDYAAAEEKIVAFVNYRRPAAYIKDLIEQLYIQKTSTAAEKASYAQDMRRNPDPARYGDIQGVPWHGRIWCGNNPYLYARIVDNIRVEQHDLAATVTWDERPVPTPL